MFGRCPCGSSRPLSVCCGRFHAGAEPPDAPALMRSRWSAYAVRDFAYLWRTLHSDHPERPATFEDFRARAEADAVGLRYRKLLVLASAGPDAEGYAHVLFHADITRNRAKRSFAEHSRFAHDGTGWRYLDGVVLPDRDLPRPIEALTFDAFHLAARR